MRIVIDFETYSDIDITKQGAYKYSESPSCRILCMSYKIDDRDTELWTPKLDFPEELLNIKPDDTIVAFNATFEYLIWHNVGLRDFPNYFKPLPITNFLDAQALCTRYKFPHSLGNAAKAIGCDTSKLAIGKRLIRVCCTPGYNPTQKDFADLFTYCIVDTDVTAEILDRLPSDHLTPMEQRLWELTHNMNAKGVPIDIESVDAIIKYLAVYIESMLEILPELTDHKIRTIGQIQKIKQYCKDNGVDLPNVQAGTIVDTLARDDLPESVRTLLEIRRLIGQTSVAKYAKIKHYYNNGWVQGNLFYYGAGTGRWAGRAFQFHNLPRAKVDDPEKYIQKFIDKQPIDRPVDTAKALIRPMIKAPKGYRLIVSDYTSIENMILAWLCDDDDTLEMFKNGSCQYSDMAAFLYGIPVEEIGKKSMERQMGKVIILGCGYQMGKFRFRAVAKDWGFDLSDREAESIILAYRQKYNKVVQMWKAYSSYSMAAVRHPGKMFEICKCKFKVLQDKQRRRWLRITLPSGRTLMYLNPRIDDDKYGLVVKYDGYSLTTFQMQSKALTPGLITENIVQAAARDVLAQGKLNIVDYMPEVELILSVHDEAGGLIRAIDIDILTMDRFNNLLCSDITWAKGLPLKASGYIEKRYKKD